MSHQFDRIINLSDFISDLPHSACNACRTLDDTCNSEHSRDSHVDTREQASIKVLHWRHQ